MIIWPGQPGCIVEPKWVKALYRAGIDVTDRGWRGFFGTLVKLLRVELLESAT